MEKETLKKIALECVGDAINYEDKMSLSDFAERYNILLSELSKAVDEVDINNTRNQFEDNVVRRLKLVQGIYY